MVSAIAMKTLRLIACIIPTSFLFASNVSAQITAKRLTKKITDANAAANQVNQQEPARTPPAPVAKPPQIIITNNTPEKTAEQKAKILQKTIEFQKKRAEEGAPTAQYDLGMRYLNGDGVEKDSELGQKWLSAAATNGNTQAIRKLEELKKK